MYSTNTHLYWDPPLLSSELSIYRIKRCVKYGSFHGEHYSLLGESEPPVSIMQGSTGSLLLEKYKLSMTQRWAESFDHISEPVLNLDKLDAKFSHVISFLQEIQPRKGFLDSLVLLKTCSDMENCHIPQHTCHLKSSLYIYLIPKYPYLTLLISPSLLLDSFQYNLSSLY